MEQTVGVRLFAAKRGFDRLYSYRGESFLRRGMVVAVPFGRADRPAFGIVCAVSPEENQELKPVLFALSEPYALSEELMALCDYLAEQLLCPLGELARVALPSGLTMKIKEFYVLSDPTAPLAGETASTIPLPVLSRLNAGEAVFSEEWNGVAFLGRGISKRYLPLYAGNQKTQTLYTATAPISEDALKGLSSLVKSRAEALLIFLSEKNSSPLTNTQIKEKFSLSDSSIATLLKRGLLETKTRTIYRSAYAVPFSRQKDDDVPKLNQEQEHAYNTLAALMEQDEGNASLLYGVTGSGKTRVMVSLIEKALQSKKGVLYLVPEIALTARLARDLMERFPDEVALLHSGLSEGERHDAWVALARGERRIALGTRSAVFAPVQNLGLILVDEEQDQSYCADNAPRFHARVAARFRAAKSKALLVLASATPDIETYHKAKSGIYTFCELKNRAGGASLPEVEIVDIKPDLANTPDRLIGTTLQNALAETLARGEQAILFMNRRGYQYSPFCAACGKPLTCPNCSVTLTFHKDSATRARCHYCGYSIPAPDKCPSCGAKHLFFKGFGTQRLEEEVHTLFPEITVLRMDADTVGAKLSHDRLLGDFAAGKAQILLGTQMVTKGHDFPNVTLTGVVMADASLYLGDYRASEETFALLTQVVGRAGRAQKNGRAIVQTLNPEHEIFTFCVSQDYDTFYRGEIALRRAVLYPPFCHLSSFTLSCKDEKALDEAALDFNTCLEKKLAASPAVKLIVYGPFEPPINKVKNTYRKKFFIKHQNNRQTRALFSSVLDESLSAHPLVAVYYDATPSQSS